MTNIKTGQVWKYNDIRNANSKFVISNVGRKFVSVKIGPNEISKRIASGRLVSSTEKRGYTFVK